MPISGHWPVETASTVIHSIRRGGLPPDELRLALELALGERGPPRAEATHPVIDPGAGLDHSVAASGQIQPA